MNEELPKFIYYGGITGLVLLAISVIIFVVYMAMFNQARDTHATVTRLSIPSDERALMISYIVIGSLGFFFSLLIPFGHYLKQHHDPSVVSSKNGLHFERSNFDANRFEAYDLKSNRYKRVNEKDNIKARKDLNYL
jgi:uncharacterized membrane protein YsdA (DUF1294 family)